MAAALISENLHLKSIAEGDIAAHLAKDGLSTLKAVVATRKKVLSLMKTLETMSTQVKESLNDDQRGSSLEDLFSLEVPPAFQSELDSEHFDDIVSTGAAAHMRKIKDITSAFKASLTDHYATNQIEDDPFESLRDGAAWTSLPENPSNMDFNDVAGKIITQKLPAKAMKQFAQHAASDRVVSRIPFKILDSRLKNSSITEGFHVLCHVGLMCACKTPRLNTNPVRRRRTLYQHA